MGDFSAASITREAEALLDPRFDSDQMQLLESNERHIAERNAAVEQIMTSVVELQEIFKEIHVLVIDQGTLLDRIDYNIEQASDKISGAVKELETAEKHQKNSKVMLCIYLLLVLCCAMAVVLVLKKSMQRKS
jgi:syntaxin 16